MSLLADPLLEPCPLQPRWPALLRVAAALPAFEVLTANGTASLRSPARDARLEWLGPRARLSAPGLELRLCPASWASAQANREGLAFLDLAGKELLRLRLPQGTLRDLTAAWRLEDCCHRRVVIHPHRREGALPDRIALLEAWSALEDARHFPALLSRFGLRRHQALRLAEGRYSEPTGRATAALLLEMAVARKVNLALFAGNGGCLHIAAGRLQSLAYRKGLLEVQGDDFRFTLDRNRVERAWFVAKPTAGGLVRSLELFDAQGEVVAQVFARREPGEADGAAWRGMLDDLGVRL